MSAEQDATILRVLLTDWLPTAEHINALPEALRKFIHDLETNADPARMVAENALLKDTAIQLQVKITLLQATIDRLKIDRDKYKQHNAVAQKVAVAERVEKKKVQTRLDVAHREIRDVWGTVCRGEAEVVYDCGLDQSCLDEDGNVKAGTHPLHESNGD